MSIEQQHPTIQQLVVEHHGAVFGYAYRLCGDRHLAEDLTQQTFLTAHRKISQLRQSQSVLAWLFTIVRNDFLKEVKRRRPEVWDAEWMEEQPDVATDSDEGDSERIQLALQQMPDVHRVILLMYYFEERSYKQIAEALDIPIGTVMSRLARARDRMKQLLEEQGLA